jgi:hypothetical protein
MRCGLQLEETVGERDESHVFMTRNYGKPRKGE